jgi:hypothetical protein
MAIASLGMFLFLRTFKLPKPLCLIGSMLVFLNGYVTYIPAISHHNVDILLPWIGFLINKSFETRQVKYFVTLGMVTAFSHLGGMPESSVFVALFFGLYVFFLSFFVGEKHKIKIFLWFIGSFVFSLALSAILIIPGAEYIGQSLSIHHPGIPQLMSVPYKNIFYLAFPKLLGSLWGSMDYQPYLKFSFFNWNYIGTFAALFLLTSPFLVLFHFRKLKTEPYFKYFVFFLIFLFFLLAQYYGLFQNPIFTKLPGFSQTNFPKYNSSLINLLTGTIVVFTIYLLIKYKCKLCLIPPILALVLFETVLFLKLRPIALSLETIKYEALILQLGFSAFIIATATILIWHGKFFGKKINLLYLLLLLLIGIELFMYLPHRGDMKRRDSLRKPPFIDLIKSLDSSKFRTFSPDYILYPDLSAVFDINDIRNLDALWQKNYYNYLKEFVVPDLDKGGMRFTGLREQGYPPTAKYPEFNNNVFFDLLSVKYVLAYGDVNNYTDYPRLQNYIVQLTQTPILKLDLFNINGVSRPVLFEHSPQKITIKATKPTGATYFYLYPALSEKVFQEKNKGNGVKFIAEAVSNGYVISRKEITANPQNNLGDRKWFEIALGPFPNDIKDFSLILETDQRENNAWDWAGWAGFEWNTEKTQAKQLQFKKIYDSEIKIYENSAFVPRLHPIKETVCAVDENDVLKKMHSLRDQIRDEGVVLDDNCKNQKYEPGKVVLENEKFDDQKVSFTYISPNESYVVLSNDFYPGWKLKINGKETPIEQVNYTFQGLRLPKSAGSKVEIIYEPDSFKYGLIISLSSLIISIIVLLKFGNRKIENQK